MTLDIATCTGFAAGMPGTPTPLFGEYRMAPVGASEEFVFDGFGAWLEHQFGLLRPQWCFIEDVFPPRSAVVAQRLYGLRAIALMTCHRHGVRRRSVPTHTVQKFMTAHGQWPKGQKKDATIRACYAMGWHPRTDNEADALALFAYAEHAIAPHAAGQRTAGPLFGTRGAA